MGFEGKVTFDYTIPVSLDPWLGLASESTNYRPRIETLSFIHILFDYNRILDYLREI